MGSSREILIFVTLVACGTPTSTDSPAGDTAPEQAPETVQACDESVVTWHTFAEGFFLDYCASCHSDGLQEALRQGAPSTINLDTREGVDSALGLVELVLLPEAANPMPPAQILPLQDLEWFDEWMACGAP